MIEIKHKITGEVLITIDSDNLQGANLQGADLQGADLQWADLQWANLQRADLQGVDLPTEVIRINGLRWDVTILHGYMRIGCQYHSVEKWEKFSDRVIEKMDSNALEFWQKNKDMLLTIAKYTVKSEATA